MLRKSGMAGDARRAARGFCRDERGVTAIMTGLLATALMGFAGLAVDVGIWEMNLRNAQGAADLAAYSAAIGANKGADTTIEAKGVAASMGFIDGDSGVTVTVRHPPISGPHAGDSAAYEIIVQKPQQLYLAQLFLPKAPTVRGRAVARAGKGLVE